MLIPNVLEISKIENDGMAFNFNQKNMTNIVLLVIVLIVIIRFIILQKKNLKNKNLIALGMMLAGGISNLIDIIFRGAILDFIKISSFPVFNFADCFMVLRMGFICNIFNNILS